MSIDLINPKDFDYVSTKLREFFKSKGLIEAGLQHRLSILAACEDPKTISLFNYAGQCWPLPQTSQMWLEYELLKNPVEKGFFSYSTSYREEKNPILGRHNLIFPMFEFEIHGGMEELINFEKELLVHLGYDKSSFREGDYVDIAKKYNVIELEHEHEQRLYKDYGPVFFLKNFPESTNPFWNMARDPGSEYAKKIDVILSGMETIGSAERACNSDEMRKRFHMTSDGQYAGLLYEKFGKERVEGELEEFLSHKFIKRAGGGIGGTRIISSMKKEGILEY
jgi:aspartyl/asparaginyl-tRNA synthetase